MEAITSENVMLIGSLILMVGVLIGKTSYRTGLPLLLIFLLVGMGFGIDGLGVQFSDIHTAQSIGMIALCIILFSGGLETKVAAIRPVLAPGLVLSTVGVLLTALLTGIFVWWLSGMSWTNIHFALLPSLLLAATMSSTDSASVFGILGTQNVHLKQQLRPMLELESGSNDPMAYMLTILLIETIQLGGSLSAAELLWQLLLQFGIGIAGGYVCAKITQWAIIRYRRIGQKAATNEDGEQASSMISILTLGAVFMTFSAVTLLGGNGYLAVYLLGILIGHYKVPCYRGVTKFMGGMSWLGQIVVFLMLGLLVNPREMMTTAAVSLLVGVFIILVGRPLSVMVCLLPFRKVTMKARLFVSWVGLRGAVPIIFATYPVIADVEGASQIFNIVFFVTLLSLLIQGTTVVKAARWLRLVKPQQQETDFGVELSDDVPTSLHTVVLNSRQLERGNTLRDLALPQGSLVMMIKRGDRRIVPNGTVKLRSGDALLIIQEEAQ